MINIGKRGFLHYLSTIALIVMVSLAGIVLFVVEAANQDNLLVSTPTHVEAYDLSVNGTLIMYADGTQVCNSTTNVGALYFDGSLHYACDGSSWSPISSAASDTWQNYVWRADSDDNSPVSVTNNSLISFDGAGTVTTSRTSGVITITGSAHTTDTGPGPDCTGSNTYQDGEGNCDVLIALSNFTDDLGHSEDNSSWNKSYADTLYSNYSDADIDGTEAAFTGWDKDSSDDLTLTAVATNLGNWSADKNGYYTSTQVDTLGNWSADKNGYYTSTQVDTLGNWSADSVNYYTITQINAQFASLPNLTLAEIATNIGNWSADKSGYYTTTQVDAQFASLPNLTLTQIATNVGNWSLDKPNYATGDHTNLTDADILAFGYVHGAHTNLTDTDIIGFGFVKGDHTNITQSDVEGWGFVTGAHTNLTDSDISGFGYFKGAHTNVTQSDVEGWGFVTGAHTNLTDGDISGFGYVKGAHTNLTQSDIEGYNLNFTNVAETQYQNVGRMYDNTTCVIIEGSTSKLVIC